MKRQFLLLLTTAAFLCGCSNNKNTSNPENFSDSSQQTNSSSNGGGTSDTSGTSAGEEEVIVSTNLQDANILHAWNWRMDDIKSRLQAIKNAGYEAVQISPLQPHKEKDRINEFKNYSTKSQWWKIYQPLALKVAGNNESFLGTKAQLTSLCTEAKKYNLAIIADVVANHVSGGSDGSVDSQVYKNYPTHNDYNSTDDNNGKSVVHGRIGLPDLDTSSTLVQNDTLSLVKEYIDCGVSGFRFDAAKHIETPDDPDDYKSEFWSVVLDGATSYAESLGKDKPYYYGEVLNTPGAGRSWNSYAKLMSICDNKQATDVTNAVKNGSTSSLSADYRTGLSGDKLVLWAESHDTYANDSGYEITRGIETEKINQSYMIQASRKDAATLYLARINDIFSDKICTIKDDSGWKSAEVKAANDFHTHYIGKSENITIQDNKYFVNVRGSGTFAGAAIVNISGSTTANINVNGLSNGTYTDLISGNDFTVSNGTVNAKFTKGGCLLVPKGSSNPDTPSSTSQSSEEVTYTSKVVLKNYDSSKYYYAWVFGGSSADKWIKLNDDHDALGFDNGSYTKFIIVEMNSDSASWSNKSWQSIDYTFSEIASNNQAILDCNTIEKA